MYGHFLHLFIYKEAPPVIVCQLGLESRIDVDGFGLASTIDQTDLGLQSKTDTDGVGLESLICQCES